jgi:hypothetical protein
MNEIERVKIVVYPDGRLDSKNAARFLGLSPKTLAMMRTDGRHRTKIRQEGEGVLLP